mmetsp:Transcript_2196/g.7222  ORF Transcript_2196/g.7222 Transcript_2196/m.7222 type:complete len:388 (+) Transcript_2196:67-1230(+)
MKVQCCDVTSHARSGARRAATKSGKTAHAVRGAWRQSARRQGRRRAACRYRKRSRRHAGPPESAQGVRGEGHGAGVACRSQRRHQRSGGRQLLSKHVPLAPDSDCSGSAPCPCPWPWPRSHPARGLGWMKTRPPALGPSWCTARGRRDNDAPRRERRPQKQRCSGRGTRASKRGGPSSRSAPRPRPRPRHAPAARGRWGSRSDRASHNGPSPLPNRSPPAARGPAPLAAPPLPPRTPETERRSRSTPRERAARRSRRSARASRRKSRASGPAARRALLRGGQRRASGGHCGRGQRLGWRSRTRAERDRCPPHGPASGSPPSGRRGNSASASAAPRSGGSHGGKRGSKTAAPAPCRRGGKGKWSSARLRRHSARERAIARTLPATPPR